MKKLGILLTLLVLALPMRVYAATVTVEDTAFTFAPGSGYTETDLFENFKDVMPGDRLYQMVELKNGSQEYGMVRLYLQAVPHDPEENPLTYNEAFEAADGKDRQDIPGQRDETVATMEDFLKELTLRVYKEDRLLYESTQGIGSEPILLGLLSKGQTQPLQVELEVPAELDNRYANRVGEVDWVFYGERVPDTLIQTGQLRWPVPVFAGLGMGMLAVGAALRRGKKHA